MEGGFGESLPSYYNYSYPYFPQEPSFPYLESTPLNNERYTGRLKFFDQAGNYGYLALTQLHRD